MLGLSEPSALSRTALEGNGAPVVSGNDRRDSVECFHEMEAHYADEEAPPDYDYHGLGIRVRNGESHDWKRAFPPYV